MKRSLSTVSTVLVVALLAQAAVAEVPRLINGPTPRDGVQELQLTEIWRHGGEDDEEVLFGLISSVITDPEGNLYALDAQLAQIMVFSPDGELLDTLGRQGTGPGEFQAPQQLALLPTGDIGVSQIFPGKLVGLNLDGTPSREITIGDPAAGGFAALVNVRSGGGNLVLSGIDIGFDQETFSQNRHHFVRSYDTDGNVLHEYIDKDHVWTFNQSFVMRESDTDFVWWRMTVDHDGRLLVNEPREEFEISVYSADGTLERVFGREYETLTRPAAVKERFQAMMEAQSAQIPGDTQVEVEDNSQDVWGIHAHHDGTYWVTTSRGMYEPPAGALIAWEVYSPEGEFLREVRANIPGKPGTDLLMLTDHGYAVKITGFWDAVLSAMGAGGQNDEAEAMEIVCYRVGEG